MWNVLSKEIRKPALAAAACAAVMLVASPVSAATAQDASAAIAAYRNHLKEICGFNTAQGSFKGPTAGCVSSGMLEARQYARAKKQQCIDRGDTPSACQQVMYQWWVDFDY